MAGTPSQQGLGGDVGSLKPPRIEDQVHANLIVFNGAPNNAVGVAGQWALRVDQTTGGARLYQKVGGTWTATTV